MDYKSEENKNDTINFISDKHLQMLQEESGIAKSLISERGYRTITTKEGLLKLGFSESQTLVPGLLLPVHAPDGSKGLYQFRPDKPRTNSKNNKSIKYETPFDSKMRVDCPPTCRANLLNPKVPLWITEGIKKGDALASHDLCAIALLGVWNFKGKNEFGAVSVLTDFDFIAWHDRETRIVFDSDIMHKPSVRKAMERLKEILERKGAIVSIVYLPDEGGGKTGVDDYLINHSVEQLEELVLAAKPIPKLKEPEIEILDRSPVALRRPLQMINGRAYAAGYYFIRRTEKEYLDEENNIVQFNPPKETISKELRVIRDDGTMYGYGTGNSINQLGFEVYLPDSIPVNRLLTPQAVRDIEKGIYLDPIEVFEQIIETVDRFFDFSRSIADQRTMCELVATYILATWFIESFTVAGYIWITGGRGSGKTQLLNLISELAYLGQTILASSSLPTIRDLADCGAFLGFDDAAENISSVKQTDPDKRALLLAGNRRGNTIAVKEPIPGERGWVTRFVSTFCHRGFTAISRPDSVLSSRTVIFPLVRTADRQKANLDPMDENNWGFSPEILRGKLWQIAIRELPNMQTFERQINKLATIAGRNLEAWRGILAVALWLDSRDKDGRLIRQNGNSEKHIQNEGLFSRINQLSQKYQLIRDDFEAADYTRLILRAIVKLVVEDAREIVEVETIRSLKPLIFLTTGEITLKAQYIVEEEDLDFEVEWIKERKIGRIIKQLRFASKRQNGTGRSGWIIKPKDLEVLLDSYGLLNQPENLQISSDNSFSISLTSLTSQTQNEANEIGEVSEIKREGSEVSKFEIKAENDDEEDSITI